MGEIWERREFAGVELCRRAVRTFDALADLHVNSSHGQGQKVLHFGALASTGSAMDDHGHLLADPSPGRLLKEWMNTLRASIPTVFGLENLYPELTLLCRAPDGSAMPSHKDYGWRAYSAILYLNEDFEGGETYFADGSKIRPETGKLVMFRGGKVEHGVATVSGGSRYNVSLWWSHDPLRLEA